MQWLNRITRVSEEKPESLNPSKENARVHTKTQEAFTRASLDESGWIDDVIASERTRNILNGHLRIEIARLRKEATVPVRWVDVTEAEERLILASFDPLEAMATKDRQTFAKLLEVAKPKNKVLENFLCERRDDNARILQEFSSRAAAIPSQMQAQAEVKEVRVKVGKLSFLVPAEKFNLWISALMLQYPVTSELISEIQRRLGL